MNGSAASPPPAASRPPGPCRWGSSGCEGTTTSRFRGGQNGYDPHHHVEPDRQDHDERTAAPPRGKLADAELHFNDGPLEGLKLIGFAIWERRTGAGRNVTFPARQYSVNGERRSFALLRPIADATAQDRVRELILEAYAEIEAATDDAR